jgi:DNA-binding CsgD family transcriptional regulator
LFAGLLFILVVGLGFDIVGDLDEGVALSHVLVEIGAGTVSLILLALTVAEMVALKRTNVGLEKRLDAVLEENARFTARSRESATRLRADIDDQFIAWGLTPAEREVALLLMRGFAFKDVAATRGTGERTARTQGLAIYQKAGLRGARELTAFFLGEVLKPDSAFANETSRV